MKNEYGKEYCKTVEECEEIFVGNCIGCPHAEKFHEDTEKKDGVVNE